ncbi:16S rRNA (adenine(1518)-N(6)/adenine(1519)-N(6))-dimethyltransferase RsmA [Mycoplasma iguanae]|uniref:Ribosomal RNA small subunit methyltransferase A n=1 Tax=Mycoplasma iguanae TaxID=292461 RepID=A0ABY5RAH5_9MOLU|nr:16S rRNA (adenine(1518)-N(6)/adenine(1519)-N(6))-dimethyltransferase RsmA [Mycoplasma iguanae]UVD81615.1 16S rRNA (adenine(1518)-N(6)/adenine(1519)-N(6))-dimethyltransferase RsmA [Mycoplasma iguanae]
MLTKGQFSKKHFGQNFLQDKNIINKIIDIANIDNQDVLEIGPGRGALTQIMVSKAKSLLAFEIDQDMIEILNNTINANNFTLVNGDFLKHQLIWQGKKKIVANLPYYITSKIIFKIFEHLELFSSALIMVQEEVADRIIAKVNTANYSKLSVVCQYFATVKKEFSVPPTAFRPVPKVHSAIVSFEFNKITTLDTKSFLLFIKNSFSMKRKTLANNWKKHYSDEFIKGVFKEFKLNSNIRPQEISLKQYQQFFQKLESVVK